MKTAVKLLKVLAIAITGIIIGILLCKNSHAQDLSVLVRDGRAVNIAENGYRTYSPVKFLGMSLSDLEAGYTFDVTVFHNGAKNVTGFQVLWVQNFYKTPLGENWGLGVNSVVELTHVMKEFNKKLPKDITAVMAGGSIALVKTTPWGKIIIAEVVGGTYNMTTEEVGVTVRTLVTLTFKL